MLKGFKDFVLRGNIIDLSVAVVIGAAFSGVVNQFTKSFIEPLIRLFGGGGVGNYGMLVINGVPFDWPAFINAVINLLIVAAVLYFLIITPANQIKARLLHPDEQATPAAPVTPEDIALLREIRDLLQQRRD